MSATTPTTSEKLRAMSRVWYDAVNETESKRSAITDFVLANTKPEDFADILLSHMHETEEWNDESTDEPVDYSISAILLRYCSAGMDEITAYRKEIREVRRKHLMFALNQPDGVREAWIRLRSPIREAVRESMIDAIHKK